MTKKNKQWPAENVEKKKVKDLVPRTTNARIHSKTQIKEIADSIKKWGWTNPALIDESGSILCGHGRVMAAEYLGLSEIPVMIAHGWTEAEKRAYVIADNKLHDNSDWDMGMLHDEVQDLLANGFDMSVTGFSDSEIDELFAEKPKTIERTEELRPVDTAYTLICYPLSRAADIQDKMQTLADLSFVTVINGAN